MSKYKRDVNDLWTTRPDIAKLLCNYEDGYLYTKTSTKKVKWKCPICNEILEKSINSVTYGGLKCPHCHGRKTYPNRFMFRILQQLEKSKQLVYFTREYCKDWCHYEYKGILHRCIYDFYCETNNQKFIIEMDGGFHYEDTKYAKTSLQDQQIIDNIKDELASRQELKVIRINCNYGKVTDDRFSYIRNSILNSELKNIFDLSAVDFIKADMESNKSDILLAGKLYNKNLSINEIAENLKVGIKTVRKYLKSATKMGICNYNAEYNQSKYIKAYNENNKRKVVLLNTLEIFDSIKDAETSKYCPSNVYMVCNGMRNYSGVYNNEQLVWRYYEDYLKMSNTEIFEILNKCKLQKILCVEQNIIYDNTEDACMHLFGDKKYKKSNIDYINHACKMNHKAYGFHWSYYNYIAS